MIIRSFERNEASQGAPDESLRRRSYGTLHRINNILSLVVISAGLYLIVLPLIPWVEYRAGGASHTSSISQTQLNDIVTQPENRLVIPSAAVSEEVLEGTNVNTVNRGAWHRPLSSNPTLGGNTVIVGHRFTFSKTAKHVFYNLDKVEVGDMIYLTWNKKLYQYRTSAISTVDPSDASVEASTDEARLTLYTCTPLISATHRLVITAILVNEAGQQ